MSLLVFVLHQICQPPNVWSTTHYPRFRSRTWHGTLLQLPLWPAPQPAAPAQSPQRAGPVRTPVLPQLLRQPVAAVPLPAARGAPAAAGGGPVLHRPQAALLAPGVPGAAAGPGCPVWQRRQPSWHHWPSCPPCPLRQPKARQPRPAPALLLLLILLLLLLHRAPKRGTLLCCQRRGLLWPTALPWLRLTQGRRGRHCCHWRCCLLPCSAHWHRRALACHCRRCCCASCRRLLSQ